MDNVERNTQCSPNRNISIQNLIHTHTHHQTDDDKRQILFGSRLCGSFPSAAEHLKACGRILLRDGEVFARKRTRALESLPQPQASENDEYLIQEAVCVKSISDLSRAWVELSAIWRAFDSMFYWLSFVFTFGCFVLEDSSLIEMDGSKMG